MRGDVVASVARAGQDRLGFAPRAGQVSGGKPLPRALDPRRAGAARGHQALPASAAG